MSRIYLKPWSPFGGAVALGQTPPAAAPAAKPVPAAGGIYILNQPVEDAKAGDQ